MTKRPAVVSADNPISRVWEMLLRWLGPSLE
jgi:hypothetical protein